MKSISGDCGWRSITDEVAYVLALKQRSGRRRAGPCHVRRSPYISRATEVKQRTSCHARPFRLSDYRALARKISRPPSALFAADAKRRQGLDHAGEIGLPYEVHLVDFNKDDQKTPEFLSLNPNGKIPAILDPDGPDGKPLGLFESGAILQYLAEKTAKLLSDDAARRYETIQWVHFQMGGIGPMFGQVGYFHKFAGHVISDKRPLQRYVAESRRLLDVVEPRLDGRPWIMGDEYTIADISMLGWVRNLVGFYGAREIVAFDTLKHVSAWLESG